MHVAPFAQPQDTRRNARGMLDAACGATASAASARRRTPRARAATGNPSARRGTRGAPGRRPAACSSGRSRGSCTDSALAMTSTSRSAALVARGEDHAADARVERQPRELAADRRELVRVVDRAELLQQLVAVGDRARAAAARGTETSSTSPRSQRLHAQDHAGERRAQDLRIGEARPRREVVLVVQADADAVPRRGRSGPRAGWPRPARSARSAAARPCCASCSA